MYVGMFNIIQLLFIPQNIYRRSDSYGGTFVIFTGDSEPLTDVLTARERRREIEREYCGKMEFKLRLNNNNLGTHELNYLDNFATQTAKHR